MKALTRKDYERATRIARELGKLSACESELAMMAFDCLLARDALDKELQATAALDKAADTPELQQLRHNQLRRWTRLNESFMKAYDLCQRILHDSGVQ